MIRFFLATLLLAACHPTPAPAGPPDAPSDASDPPPVVLDASGTPCDRMCLHLAAIGCSDGKKPACSITCAQAEAARVSATFSVAKLTAAQSIAEAKAAGAACE